MPINRRIDVKAILADEELRRKLMVSTIQATQAREGIDTTRDQADRAYYVVTEGERTAFFDLSKYQDQREKGNTKYELFIRTLQGVMEGVRVDVARRDFSFIEGSPLVYRNVSIVGPLFRDLPHLDPTYGRTRSGLNTTEIERFVRERWEVSPSTKRQWVLFAKGGNYSRFYTDWDLVFDWTNDGYEFKEVVAQKYGSASRFVKSEDDYFSEGITWTQTTVLGINARILPNKGIFGVASPTLFLHRQVDRGLILAIMNSEVFDMLARCVARRNWGATAIGSLPVPVVGEQSRVVLESRAETIFQRKASWDEGNEICAHFTKSWILKEDIVEAVSSIPDRLDQLVAHEASEDTQIQKLYTELNDEAYHIYGLPESIRQMVKKILGKRPRELIWPQMEGKTVEQKRMEHIWRLLSYVVKRVVEADPDGIVPFMTVAGETELLERVRNELTTLFPDHDVNEVEVEIVNELRRRVNGYKRVTSIHQWLDDVFFDYHVSLYKNRPIIWHISSMQGTGEAAFAALVHYHKFDRNRMAKLRSSYLREALNVFRREAGLASQEGRANDRLEWQSKIEETEALDQRLQWVQEGQHEGVEGSDRDFRILTPWKSTEERPKGWDPDLDDGVKVNIEPLQRAGVLRRNDLIR